MNIRVIINSYDVKIFRRQFIVKQYRLIVYEHNYGAYKKLNRLSLNSAYSLETDRTNSELGG